jgi:predicted hydrocarbon binding protein
MEDRPIENKAFRVILLGVQEIVGENGLKSVLNYSGLTKYIGNIPPNDSEMTGPKTSDVYKLNEGIEEIFGKRGARAILLQVGKKQARLGIDENPDIARAALSAMETMSERDRVKTVITFTADTASKQFNSETRVQEEGDDFLYETASWINRKSDTPLCHSTVGFLSGLVAWAVGGNDWKVQETRCVAMGDAMCVFRICRA